LEPGQESRDHDQKLKESSPAFVSIISPTYNERDNIIPLVKRISKTMLSRKYEIIFVDDSSQDGTVEIAKELSQKYPVKILVRDKKFGLASAILTGFENARGNIIGVIDADLQHPPESIIQCVEAIEHDHYDIAIGSRYIHGGGVEGWSMLRLLTSRIAILLAKPLIGNIKDPMSGFFFMRKSVLNCASLNPTGYKLGLEILLKGNYKLVKEIPYVFKERKNGVSKLNNKEIILYLSLLRGLYWHKFVRW
jgi:dolichol-phosphate mannosyltransferase